MCAYLSAVKQLVYVLGVGAVHNHGVDARARRYLARMELGYHAARASARAAAARKSENFIGYPVDRAYQPRALILPRICAEETVYIGQDHQSIRLDQLRHMG